MKFQLNCTENNRRANNKKNNIYFYEMSSYGVLKFIALGKLKGELIGGHFMVDKSKFKARHTDGDVHRKEDDITGCACR